MTVIILGRGRGGPDVRADRGPTGAAGLGSGARPRGGGEKILISGGGRCNFTNPHATPENFFSDNPDFCRSALSALLRRRISRLVEQHGIAWHEKNWGNCSATVRHAPIVAMLLAECEAARVELRLAHGDHCRSADGFRAGNGPGHVRWAALSLRLAGCRSRRLGLRIRLRIAEQFGLRLFRTAAGAGAADVRADDQRALMRPLSGISLDAR